MSKTKTYLFHELSSIFPLMEGEDFNALVEDMREKGQLKKGVLFEEKILDGRNRYRACGILKIPFKTEEYSEKISPRDYIISENLMRRHLNLAQRSEIGLLLLEEEEKLAEERKSELVKLRVEEGKKGFKKSTEIENLQEKLVLEKFGEKGTSVGSVAPKVRISARTLSSAKKIKEVAEKEPIIKKEWEKAKKGKTSVDAVYQKARIIEKLPEDLKKEVVKEEPKISFKEAKVIAEIPSVELRKKEIAERVIVKKRQESEIKKKVDIATGKILPKEKFFDKDANKLDAIKSVCQRAMNELTFAGLEGYGDFARKECIKMMKILFEHLRKELKKAGEVAPRKVIDVDVD